VNTTLNILGGLALCVAPVLFIIGSLKKEGQPGKIDPNAATFFIRSVCAWLNLATYFEGSQTTWIRCFVLIVSSISLTILCGLSLFAGRLRMVKPTEIACLVMAIVLGIVWKEQRATNPVTANLLMQGILVISFIPAAWRSYTLEEKQTSATWLWATFAYFLMTAALLSDSHGFKPFQLVNPIIPGIGGNGLLAILAYRQEKIRAKSNSKNPLHA
jgi:drug/metabolite transporter (DMT)-like permease